MTRYGETPEDWTEIDVPEWLWSRKPQGLFEDAGLRVLTTVSDTLRVRTLEAYNRRNRAELIETRVLVGAGRRDRLEILGSCTERVSVDFDQEELRKALAGLAERVDRAVANDLAPLGEHVQMVLSLSDVDDLPDNLRSIVDGLGSIGYSDGKPGDPGPFARVGVVLVAVSASLMMRLRIPSVLLRIEADPRLKSGDISHIQDEDMIFPSSRGLYEGVYLMGPYLGPLRACSRPAFWMIAAPRTFGTIMVPLGRAIRGTSGHANEMLDLVHVEGRSEGAPVPLQTLEEQISAIEWWVSALDDLFGVVSDPVLFREPSGRYLPTAHLEAIASIEQVFARLTSLLVQHHDMTAQHVLMFTVLDTLEGLLGINAQRLYNASHAAARLQYLKANLPHSAQKVLLPSAERAVVALAQVQEGFRLAHQAGHDRIKWGEKTSTLEDAAAYFLLGRRNATHGHGGGPAAERERRTTLLIQHDGVIPDDLPKLAYLYLLDLLANPDRLRRILARRLNKSPQ